MAPPYSLHPSIGIGRGAQLILLVKLAGKTKGDLVVGPNPLFAYHPVSLFMLQVQALPASA
ncbi:MULTISPECIES: hypothetical protein [Caldilinea]|jgi:hypothetical protein|uniref:Uncharacterized protein n=1 Tax=Caldilinea aerophila (strain DSM 14535 / JCM 11387 / NBRC 104270 / STL-6-O1) TaxID=926550 RepID=I0I2X5_CALAS|nr:MULTISPECIES: hypothetical protein [Caldilinea]MBO9392494.1 hypothetical protein [Caldilinea sp.]BAL99612.1 hypothetical protein CLDAP_15730 [Caldilinea aerophila DSM 14535 = NBRC 104270]